MQLTVENVTPAKTGKSLRVKANGDWYGAKKDSGIAAGMLIDAEVEDGEYGKWIKQWKIAAQQTTAQPAKASSAPAATASNGNLAWLPFASNTVAHAIQAGLITDPSQVKVWAQAAERAFYEMQREI